MKRPFFRRHWGQVPGLLCLQMQMLGLILLLAGCGLVGGSLPVEPAIAPTNPPRLELKSFEAQLLKGDFLQASAPKMFLWPIEKLNPKTGLPEPMDLTEQARARETIAVAAGSLQFFEAEIGRVRDLIVEKYEALQTDLISSYREMKCYSYCNPEDFIFCDPTDESVLFIEDWLVTDDPEIQDQIRLCQENQDTRQGLESSQNQELQTSLRPLQEQAAVHAQAFFGTLGDNYFTHFSEMKLAFNDGVSVPEIWLAFGDKEFSTSRELPPSQRIRDVRLDRLNGFLEFTSPMVDAQGNAIGEIFYDLELTFLSAELLKIEGDIRLRRENMPERVGRFASAGSLLSPQK